MAYLSHVLQRSFITSVANKRYYISKSSSAVISPSNLSCCSIVGSLSRSKINNSSKGVNRNNAANEYSLVIVNLLK